MSDPASEPTSRTWQLSAAVTWGGGITNFHGVDPANPFDTSTVTKVTTKGATSISLAGVTTASRGARVIGGVGIDAKTISITPPAGWTEHWEALGGQTTELSSVAQATAGATGTVTFTLSGSTTAAAWMRALRPAVG